MKEYKVYQTQHRLKFNKDIAEFAKEGWELIGPVQFQVFPDRKHVDTQTYYLATFKREEPTNIPQNKKVEEEL